MRLGLVGVDRVAERFLVGWVGLLAVSMGMVLGGCGGGSVTGGGGSKVVPGTAAPVFSVAAGTYTSAQTVAITCATAGAAIYYTSDGSVPSVSSTLYSAPIKVASSETLQAIAFAAGDSGSAVTSAAYVMAAVPPTFSVAAGTYTSVQTVALSDTTNGAQIYYTTNGTAPTASSTPYGGALTVSSSETVEAIAVASGYANSVVASAAYVINLPPVANAGGPYAGIEGIALSFNGSGSSSPQAKALTYAWDFGDGNTAAVVSPTHTYTAWGTYTVKLTVTDTSNLSNMATVQVIVPNGRAFGSQKPVVGAHVYLLAANTTGYGGMGLAVSSTNASVSLLSAASTGQSDSVGAYVLTGSDGSFFIAGDYSCTPGSQVYLYALGGSSGLGTNTGIGLLAALGACPSAGNFAAVPYVVMNEVSTIATAYAFAGFATDATHVSSSGTALAKVGIGNAFANAANLETIGTGVALATTPAGNGTVPQAEINTLANVLASCTVTGAAGSNGCALLFGDALSGGSTGATPTDTATAAINIAHNPGTNVAGLYGLATAGFTPALGGAPNDFSVALAFTAGGGLDGPDGLAIDGSGDVWIANNLSSTVTELSALGAPVSGSGGFTGGGLAAPESIAIDFSGDVWVGNYYGGSLTKLSSSGAAISPAAGFVGGGIDQPGALAIDSAGNVWANSGSSVTKMSGNGTVLFQGYGENGYPGGGIAIDTSGNVWIGDDLMGTVTELSNTGAIISPIKGFTGGGLNDSVGLAIDASGHIWVANFGALVSELSSSGTPVTGSPFSGGGVGDAFRIAIDGSGNVWVGNYYLVSELSNSGAPLSPSTGIGSFYYFCYGLVVDGSGNVWRSDGYGIAELIGIATPVVTPLAAGVKNNTLGTRP